MASDSLNQVGKYIRGAKRNSDLAIKRVTKRVPKRERARDTVSAVYPFSMTISTEGDEIIFMDLNFNKPPPSECASECIATACEQYELSVGGHSITTTNPYVDGGIRVFSNGDALASSQWYEENPVGGQVYVQVQSARELIVVCYTYVIC